MTREWQPGDVAIWDHGDGSTSVIYRFLGGYDFDVPEWQTDTDGCGYPSAGELRPAIVIDPEDREQVERLVKACPDDWAFEQDEECLREVVDHMQAALREFANPTPPKPEEPTEIGATVNASYADADGKGFGPATWARAGDGTWVCLTDGLVGHVVMWPFLTDVEVQP